MVSEICNSLGGKGGRVSFTNCVLERDIITLAKEEEEEEEEEVTRTTRRRRTRKEKKRAPSRSPRPFRTVFPVQTSSSSSSKERERFGASTKEKSDDLMESRFCVSTL